MTRPSRRVLPSVTLWALAGAAHAASGGIDGFSASATQVTVGETVNFSVSLSLGTSSSSSGGSDPVEPAPQEGFQQWNANWYSWEQESLRSVWLQAGSESFNDSPSLGPGDSYANTWSFAVTFQQPGSYSFDLTGGWQSEVHYGYSNESASRNCDVWDPESGGPLVCGSWDWQAGGDQDDWYSSSGSLSGGTLAVEVVAAPVPEPATGALALAGAGGLAAWRALRRREADAPAVPPWRG